MTDLWYRQVLGILRLELKKNLLSMRALPIYLLSGMPVFVLSIFGLFAIYEGPPAEFEGAAEAALFFASAFQVILRFVIFFGCVWIFMNLFRGEVLDRSLHYYFLTPVRREVLVAGKYLSAVVSLVIIFSAVTIYCFLVVYGTLGGADQGLLGPSGHLLAYLGVVVMGCIGYGAVFLVAGLLFRNPIIPAVVIFLWEGINLLLPALLKKISVIFYLNSLFPVSLPDGQFAVIADPVPAWISVPGLILFTAVTLVVAALRIRRMEIHYAAD